MSLSSSAPRASMQPTAFGSTGQRFTQQQLANRPKAQNLTPRQRQKMPEPQTPPMMRKSSYDPDADAQDFSDAGFYDDDESTIDSYGGSVTTRR